MSTPKIPSRFVRTSIGTGCAVAYYDSTNRICVLQEPCFVTCKNVWRVMVVDPTMSEHFEDIVEDSLRDALDVARAVLDSIDEYESMMENESLKELMNSPPGDYEEHHTNGPLKIPGK